MGSSTPFLPKICGLMQSEFVGGFGLRIYILGVFENILQPPWYRPPPSPRPSPLLPPPPSPGTLTAASPGNSFFVSFLSVLRFAGSHVY